MLMTQRYTNAFYYHHRRTKAIKVMFLGLSICQLNYSSNNCKWIMTNYLAGLGKARTGGNQFCTT